MRPGDGIAALLPNGAAAFEVMLAAAQGGWYLTPLNWHFAAPELAYILTDAEAKAFFVAERFAGLGVAAADLAELPPGIRFGYGDVPGAGLRRQRAAPRIPAGRVLHRRGHRVPGRGRLPVPVRPEGRHDHLGRGQHLPAEIQAEIIMHPQVADVAVFGIPDPGTGRATTAPSDRRAQTGTVAVSLRTSSSRAVAGGSGGSP
ncbi:MAG TPA: AMP-binding protein [Streptosporangiaceae bacterium]|nr:AMP-binding protein [Streptosporangiaceae bacterium]